MNSYIKIFIVILSILLSSCTSIKGSSTSRPPIAVGDMTSGQLLSTYDSFNEEFKAFTLLDEEAELVRLWPENVRIEAFFGTWCHDSEREVPRLLKSLNKNVEIQLIGLDYSMSEPLERAVKANIKFTPTFVIYLNNKVIGRIVEQPKESLIVDIDNLIKNGKS